jgi:hypothetical protein
MPAERPTARHDRTNGIILEAIDQQKIDELLPPFAIEIEVGFASGRGEIDFVHGDWIGHGVFRLRRGVRPSDKDGCTITS